MRKWCGKEIRLKKWKVPFTVKGSIIVTALDRYEAVHKLNKNYEIEEIVFKGHELELDIRNDEIELVRVINGSNKLMNLLRRIIG